MSQAKFYGNRWFRIGSAVFILMLGIVAMAFLASTKEEANKKDLSARVRKVTVSELTFADHTLQIHGNGSIQSQRTLNLVTLVSGEVIYSKDNQKSGLFVSQGEILVKIDDREARNRAHQARSGLINSIVSLIPDLKGVSDNTAYQKWSQYLEGLNMDNTPELPQILDAQERIRVSMHNIFNQHAMAKNAEITLERHTIRAPFDAYLIADGPILGSWMAPGQTAASLIDPFQLEIAVPLALSELDLLSKETNPKATLYPTEDHSKHLSGVLSRKNAHLDKGSQTVMLHIEASNPELDPAFFPGNYMDVYIEGAMLSDVGLLARDVIAPGSYIYTMEDSLLAKHLVKILATQGDSVVIARGALESGVQVVTTLLQTPIVGMRIAVSSDEQNADDNAIMLH